MEQAINKMASFSCEALIDAVQNEHDLCFLFLCIAPKFNAEIVAEAIDATKINVEQTIIKSSSVILHKYRSHHENRSNT